VLVEKPIALTAYDADAIYHEAKKAGVFAGEAFMYRVHPQTAKIVELVKSGAIGALRIIRTSFGFNMGTFRPEHRLFANETAGGGILDVGGYPVSMARLIAGAAEGKPFLEPEKVAGVGHLGQSGVDEWASAVLQFPGGVIAEVSCSIMANQDNTLRIIGSEGRIEVKDFWFASGHKGGVGKIELFKGNEQQTIEVKEDRWLYSFEVDAAGDAIRAGQQEFSSPGMGWADSVGNLRVLDQWRASIGLEYSVEKAAKRVNNLAGDKVALGNSIPKRAIPGISKPASVVTLGFEFFPNFAAASLTLDAFYEAGGNVFDTAFVYGGGKTESIFGDWHTSRNVNREEIVLIGKGAHSPLVYPDVIAKQLDQSLNRLKTDYVDIYFMHRDNTDVPVGEFVDAMDAEVKRGRIRGIFGGSNWTRERMDEAAAYAAKNGKLAPAALSNNYSLAEMLDPIWAGCVTSSTDEWKTWLNERQVPNFAWSSQGRGFFTDRAGRDKQDDEEIVRCWYSDRNFVRRDRAIELAAKLGRSPIHIALAYVIAQPFPVIPLIGPRTIAELEDSLSALDIKLTPEQVKWLEA
jgi:aryl-alcohol dehydrogenase-like predicted oxidoreductase/predicted dehydrogenase